MENTPPKVALLVHSCDAYEFLFQGFAYFFARHWDFSIPCTLYFATEEKEVDIPGFQNIRSGRGEWADRLTVLLREHVKEDYVIYIQEDMWLTKDVNPAFFTQLFDLVLAKGWKQVKLHSGDVYKTTPTPHSIEGFTVAKLDNGVSGYLMSHQVALWDKQFLLAQLYPNEHPWRNERRGTKRLKKLNPEIYQVDYFAPNGNPANNRNQKPVGRSEYYTISGGGMLNEHIPYYIEELLKGEPRDKGYGLRLLYHFENNLTHQGKPKRQKKNLYREAKHWIRRKLGIRK